jgi:hypothetical protein
MIVRCCIFAIIVAIASPTGIPLYYIDPQVLQIFEKRATSCLLHGSALNELTSIRSTTINLGRAGVFFRAQELYAYNFFVEQRDVNPYRVKNAEDAEFEYIPILPLHWRSTEMKCSYKALMDDILLYIAYTKGSSQIKKLPVFFVSGALNLRTFMGEGMPSQLRKGESW